MPKRNELKLTKRAVDALAAIRSPKPGRARRLAVACVFLLAAVAFSVSAEAGAGDATGAPGISGEPVVGKTITAQTRSGWIADPDGLTSSTFTYQWIREDADGSNSADINTATASTYTLTTADAGKKIKVKVSFMDDATQCGGTDQHRVPAAGPEHPPGHPHGDGLCRAQPCGPGTRPDSRADGRGLCDRERRDLWMV